MEATHRKLKTGPGAILKIIEMEKPRIDKTTPKIDALTIAIHNHLDLAFFYTNI